MASPAAVLSILVNANTSQATAALARTDAQLKKTAATANTTTASMGSKIKSGAKVGSLALAAMGAVSIKAASDFESSFAEVRKTVDTSEKGFKRLEDGLRSMAKEIPVSVNELNNLAGQAGALGIKSKDIVKFTKTAAELGITTDLSASDAANALARLSNVMGTSSKDFRRLGSTFVELGNKGASTEAEIAAMALRISGAGKQVNLTEAEVLSFASALASVGIEAEAGGSAISRAFITMAQAVDGGGADLAEFAEVAGVSSAKFAKTFEDDAAGAMVAFMEGLEGIKRSGGSVFDTLDGLELGEIRVRDALLRASGAGDLFSETLKVGSAEWERNTALTEEASKRYATTAAQAEIFKNKVYDLFITIGQHLDPAVKKLLETLNKLDFGPAIADIKEFFATNEDAKAFLEAVRNIGKVIKTTFNDVVLPILRTVWPIFKDFFGGLLTVVRGFVRVLSGLLTGDFALIWEGVKDIVGGAVQAIIAVLRGAITPAVNAAKALGSAVAKPIKAAFLAMKDVVVFAFDKMLGAISSALGVAADIVEELSGVPIIGSKFEGLADAAETAQHSIDRFREKLRGDSAEKKQITLLGKVIDAFDGLSDQAMDTADAILRGAQRATPGFQKIGDASAKMVDRVVGNVNSMVNQVSHGLKVLGENTNDALKGFGAKAINFTIKSVAQGANKVAGMQRGGPINQGAPSGDTVPAMLERGEYVLNRNAVKALGTNRLDAINFGAAKRFQKGGAVVEALGPYDIPPFSYDANHAGGNSHMHIAMSTPSAVVALGKRLQGMGMMVGEHPAFGGVQAVHAAGGYHYSNQAIDVNTAADETRAEVASVARLLGGVGGAIAKKIERVLLSGPDGPLKSMGQGALDKVHKAANAFLGKQRMEGVETGASISADGNVESVFANVAKKLSTSKTATLALGMAGYAESGMQDLSYGHSSSQGALQLLASTAAGLGVSPHDEGAIASLFFNQGFYGKGGANSLAAAGLPAHLVAQNVQGSAFSDGSNYAAQTGPAKAWMSRYGLQKGGLIQGMAKGGKVRKSVGGLKNNDSPFGPTFNPGGITWGRAELERAQGFQKALDAALIGASVLEEQIYIADTIASIASSEFGEELGPNERKKLVSLHEQLLKSVKGGGYVAGLGKQITDKGIQLGAKGAIKNQLTDLGSIFQDAITETFGLTGAGGRVFDLTNKINELKTGSSTAPTPSILDMAGLRELLQAARYGVFDGQLPKFHTGGIVPGPIGQERPIMALGGEQVLTRNQQSDNFVGYATIQIGGETIAENVRMEFNKRGREQREAQMAGVR